MNIQLFKSKKYMVVSAALSLFLFICSLACYAADGLTIKKNSVNPEFDKYLKEPEVYDGNYIPLPMQILQNGASKSPALESAEPLPQSYDTRTVLSHSHIPPVQDQGADGVCWAFAAYGSLEFNLAKSGASFASLAAPFNFSENNMSFLTSMYAYNDINYNPKGFYRTLYENQFPGSDLLNPGGNAYTAAAYLTRWDGPTLESLDPYRDNPPQRSWTDPKNSLTPNAHIQNIVFIPNALSKSHSSAEKNLRDSRIKSAIHTYGAVMSSFHVDNNYFNYANMDTQTGQTSFYYPDIIGNNHAITLIGWDDNYDKTNFKASAQPSENGAWIVRNSWGSDWGDDGYFYISYHDPNVGEDSAVFFDAESTANYSNLYMHDTFGILGSLGYNSADGTIVPHAWMRSDFTADSKRQRLSAVGFYTTGENVKYKVYADTDASNGIDDFASMVPLAHGSLALPGYYTIELNNPLIIEPNKKFSVAVFLENDGSCNPVPIHIAVQDYTPLATAALGQSYMSADGSPNSWEDLQHVDNTANVCLRAYTYISDFEIDPNSTEGNISVVKRGEAASGTLVLGYKSNENKFLGYAPQAFDIPTGAKSVSLYPPASITPNGTVAYNAFLWNVVISKTPPFSKLLVPK